MQVQDPESEFDLGVEPRIAVAMEAADNTPRDAYQVRRLIERRAELRRLRELLEEPDLEDFDP